MPNLNENPIKRDVGIKQSRLNRFSLKKIIEKKITKLYSGNLKYQTVPCGSCISRAYDRNRIFYLNALDEG